MDFVENPFYILVKLEILNLLEVKNLAVDVTHNNKTQIHTIKIKKNLDFILCFLVTRNYPFSCPILTLLCINDVYDFLSSLQKSINDDISEIWNPSITIIKLVNIITEKIISYKNKKLLIEKIKTGNIKTLDIIKEKYTVLQDFNANYPEFLEKISGLWVKEIEIGYLIFYVKGNDISFIYESKDLKIDALICTGYYACAYHNQN